MRYAFILILLGFVTNFCFGQNKIKLIHIEEYAAEFIPPDKPCISEKDYLRIEEEVRINIQRLIKEGKWEESNLRNATSFQWPLQQAAGFNYNSFYTISAHLDQDTDANELLDYACGTRTYDGHRGTDIALHPFAWQIMNNNQVEIVAAAAGTIIYKQSGFVDDRCDFINISDWNGLIIEHSDGTRTWYAHMQTGSITSKTVGNTVVAGEYLGRVGSSGASTGPHLHFEVDGGSNATLMDPFSGTCNTLNATSCWASQKPNPESTLNTILTHSAFPSFNACPTPTTTNESSIFTAGDNVFFGLYFHDIVVGQNYTLRISAPGGAIAFQQIFSAGNTQAAAFLFIGLNFPIGVTPGTWTVEVDYEGSTIAQNFQMGAFLPVELLAFRGNLVEESIQLKWTTTTEINNAHFEIQRSKDDSAFYTIGQVKGQGNTEQEINYRFIDSKPEIGNNFYRLKQVDFDGAFEYSKVITIAYQPEKPVFTIGPNPFKERIEFDFWAAGLDNYLLELLSIQGQLLQTFNLKTEQSNWAIPVNDLSPGIYFFRIRDQSGGVIETQKMIKMGQ